MLVLVIVIQIPAELLNTGVNAQHTWIHAPNSQVKSLKATIDLALLLAVGILNPKGLDIGSPNDIVPIGVWTTSVLLGKGVKRDVIQGVRKQVRDFFEELLGVFLEGLEMFLQVLERLRGGIGDLLRDILGGVPVQDLLSWLNSRCSGA